jgi:hypothetical protein
MVSQAALDRSANKKKKIAKRLTKKSNAELFAAIAWALRHFAHGGWIPVEPTQSFITKLPVRWKDACKCARLILKVHPNKEKGWYMQPDPLKELEPFHLRFIDWSTLNPDLCLDKTIQLIEREHPNLWLCVKSYLVGDGAYLVHGSWEPWTEPTISEVVTKKQPQYWLASHQAAIRDQLDVTDPKEMHEAKLNGYRPGLYADQEDWQANILNNIINSKAHPK